MLLGKWFLSAAVIFAPVGILIAAEPKMPVAPPATQPADAKPIRRGKLTEPWSLLKDLTPEQITQIEKIHGDANEQADKVRAKEKDDITALLTPAQLTELKVAEGKKSMEAKEKRAEKLKEAATKPAR